MAPLGFIIAMINDGTPSLEEGAAMVSENQYLKPLCRYDPFYFRFASCFQQLTLDCCVLHLTQNEVSFAIENIYVRGVILYRDNPDIIRRYPINLGKYPLLVKVQLKDIFELSPHTLKLLVCPSRIGRMCLEQFFMCSSSCNLTILKHNNLICMNNGR